MRLIDADALKNDLITFFPDKCLEGITAKTLFRQILTDIDNAPTVELEKAKVGEIVKAYTKGFDTGVETVRTKGEWAFDEKGNFYCDQCKKYPHDQYATTDFCPHCGACMQKGGAE